MMAPRGGRAAKPNSVRSMKFRFPAAFAAGIFAL
jgi:hypothetical protein